MQDAQPVPVAPADPLRRHRLDLAAVEGGRWVEIRGDRWLVASYSAQSVASARAKAMADLGLPVDGDVPAHHAETVHAKTFANAILRGCKLQDAPDVVYTPAMGERIFSDPELAKLRGEIQQAALGDYTKEAIARASILGNS